MRMFMYSVEKTDGVPRMMFADCKEAESKRRPEEYVVEYQFTLDDSIPVVFPDRLIIDVGGEE